MSHERMSSEERANWRTEVGLLEERIRKDKKTNIKTKLFLFCILFSFLFPPRFSHDKV